MDSNTEPMDQGKYIYHVMWDEMGTRDMFVAADDAARAKRKAKSFNRGQGTAFTAKRITVNNPVNQTA